MKKSNFSISVTWKNVVARAMKFSFFSFFLCVQNKLDYTQENKIVHKCWLTTKYLFEPSLRLDKLMSWPKIFPFSLNFNWADSTIAFVFSPRYARSQQPMNPATEPYSRFTFHYTSYPIGYSIEGKARVDCAFENFLPKLSRGASNERSLESIPIASQGLFDSCIMLEGYFPSFCRTAEFSRVDFLVRSDPFNQNPMEKSWQKQIFNSTT